MFYPMQLRISVGGKKIVLREILILRNRWKGTTYVENRAVAIGTAGREDAVVVGFAIWLAVSLEEVLGSQFLVAVRTSEVLGMPRLSQSCYNLDQMVGEKLVFGNHFHLHGWKRRRRKKKKKTYLADNWLVASTAMSLGGSLHTFFIHVRLKGTKHRIQLAAWIWLLHLLRLSVGWLWLRLILRSVHLKEKKITNNYLSFNAGDEGWGRGYLILETVLAASSLFK